MKTNHNTAPNSPTAHIKQVISEYRSSNFQECVEDINRHAGITPVSVEPELYTFIIRCVHLHESTNGTFDIFERSGEGGLAHNLVELNPLELSIYLPHNGIRINIDKLTQSVAA